MYFVYCLRVRDMTWVHLKYTAREKVVKKQEWVCFAKTIRPSHIADKTGKLVCSHCTCMAGLGEACTHVSALLFYIDTKVCIRDSRTVTEAAAYWKLPSTTRDVTYLPVCDRSLCTCDCRVFNLYSPAAK